MEHPGTLTSHSTVWKEAQIRRIGLLEDSLEEVVALRQLLTANAMTVTCCARGDSFLSLLQRDSFDALILDWTLPDMTGFEVLKRIRGDLLLNSPILMLTARNDEFAVVEALKGGADDYLTKPWRPFELLARLQVLMRVPHTHIKSYPQEVIEGWTFDPTRSTVRFGERAVKLTHKQFEVAQMLFQHIGRPVSREHMNERIWNGDASSRTVDTHVSKVRTQLGLVASNGFQLQSIYGFGYRLDAMERSA